MIEPVQQAPTLVMIDRDGTLVEERMYLSDPDDVTLIPGAVEGLRRLRRGGHRVVVVTNQSGIGRGYFTDDTVTAIHGRIRDLLAAEGVVLDGFYVCPHVPAANCECRKPEPGLAFRAAAEHAAELSSSFVIGDKPCDIDLGKRVAATTILVRTGYGAAFERDPTVRPDFVVNNLAEAATLIDKLRASQELV